MTWQAVVLAAVGTLQVIALAWIAAWQQRAAQQVRRLNGHVAAVWKELADDKGAPLEAPPGRASSSD